MNQHEWQYIA